MHGKFHWECTSLSYYCKKILKIIETWCSGGISNVLPMDRMLVLRTSSTPFLLAGNLVDAVQAGSPEPVTMNSNQAEISICRDLRVSTSCFIKILIILLLFCRAYLY